MKNSSNHRKLLLVLAISTVIFQKMTNVFWDTFLHTVNISWSSSTSQCSNVQSHLFAESSAICRKQGHMQKDAKWVESDLNAVLKTWSFSVFRRIRGDLIILMVCLRFKILKLKKKKSAKCPLKSWYLFHCSIFWIIFSLCLEDKTFTKYWIYFIFFEGWGSMYLWEVYWE